jgi:hypothetical protein
MNNATTTCTDREKIRIQPFFFAPLALYVWLAFRYSIGDTTMDEHAQELLQTFVRGASTDKLLPEDWRCGCSMSPCTCSAMGS